MTHAFDDLKRPQPLILLGIFLIVVVGAGALIGAQSAPGSWYEALQKPSFNPPNWVFAPTWFILYILIAFAGWRTFRLGPFSAGMGLWVIQLVLNWAWSPVFFVVENLWLALAVIVVLLATIIAFIVNRWAIDRLSAALFIPYAAWVAFATLLNVSIAVLN